MAPPRSHRLVLTASFSPHRSPRIVLPASFSPPRSMGSSHWRSRGQEIPGVARIKRGNDKRIPRRAIRTKTNPRVRRGHAIACAAARGRWNSSENGRRTMPRARETARRRKAQRTDPCAVVERAPSVRMSGAVSSTSGARRARRFASGASWRPCRVRVAAAPDRPDRRDRPAKSRIPRAWATSGIGPVSSVPAQPVGPARNAAQNAKTEGNRLPSRVSSRACGI